MLDLEIDHKQGYLILLKTVPEQQLMRSLSERVKQITQGNGHLKQDVAVF